MRREARRAKRKVRAAMAEMDRTPIHRPAPLPRMRIPAMGSHQMYHEGVAEHSDYETRLAMIHGTDAAEARAAEYHMEPVNHYSGVHDRRELAFSGARVEQGEVMSYSACDMPNMRGACSGWSGASHSDIVHAQSQLMRLPSQYDRLMPMRSDMGAEVDLMGHPAQQPLEGCVTSDSFHACGVPTGGSIIKTNFYDDREMEREVRAPPAFRAFNDGGSHDAFPAPMHS